ncbi:hypothetical protein Tco_0408008 [Tanacetum coccineum]
MARQCPKPKRKRDATWFREKILLVEAQGNGKVLNEEELEFLADPGIAEGPVTYYGPDVLSKVPISDNTNNDMLNQSVQEMQYSEPSHFVEHLENEIHSYSNIISYSQYLIESKNAAVQDINSSAQQDALILSVFEQLSNQVTSYNKVNNDNLIANESLSAELERYKERFADFEKETNNLKQTLSEQSKEKELLTKTFNVFKNESKEKEAKNIDTEIALEKKVKELDNIICKMGQSVQTVHMLMKPQVFYDNNLKQALGFQILSILRKLNRLRQCFMTEIETINIELEHKVTKLIAENEHLKQTYKQLYDSIKPSRVRAKEHTDSLVNQLNQKSVEVTDLNAQLQEKVINLLLVLADQKPSDNTKMIGFRAKALCSVCNECLFDANHAMCLEDHVNSMNVRAKSASQKYKKRKEWKPTGKVFNSVGYKWKPTGRTFTLVGNVCPLTRITTTNRVSLKVPIPLEVVAPEHVLYIDTMCCDDIHSCLRLAFPPWWGVTLGQ